MTWMLKLYPRAWRRRYGAEIEALVASQPRTLQLAKLVLMGTPFVVRFLIGLGAGIVVSD